MMRDPDRPALVAREAEAVFADIVAGIEARHGVELPHLKRVTYTIDAVPRTDLTSQAPYHRRFEGLRAKPFWARTDFPPDVAAVLERFETEFAPIEEEVREDLVAERFIAGHTGYHGDSEQWRHHLVLESNGVFAPGVPERYPTLAAILGELRELRVARKCYFALLRPGARLDNHCGGTNLLLRMHLGIVVPDGEAGLCVGGETRRWARGRTLFFDDAFGHEAWNETSCDRYILLLRLLHADLTEAERALLPLVSERFGRTPVAHAIREALEAFTALAK